MKKRRRKGTVPPVLSGADFPVAGLAGDSDEVSFADMVASGVLDVLEAEVEKPPEADAQPAAVGLLPVDAELDLHGCTCLEAKTRVENFLLTGRLAGRRAVRIITGKGLHSSGQPVLPDFVEELLRDLEESGSVRHYRWEQEGKGRSGALICYL
ncbi:MAG: Smr/MutS family protein [Thermodesulfobacteriota bacterium]